MFDTNRGKGHNIIVHYKKGNVLAVVLIVVAIVGLVLVGYRLWGSQKIKQALPGTPILIYGEDINTSTSSGQWRTDWEVFMKSGDSNPKKLFVLKDTVSVSVKPTKDRRFLLINKYNELLRYELETGTLTVLLKSKDNISDLAFSPDGQKAIAWEGSWDSANSLLHYSIWIITPSIGQSVVVKQDILKNAGSSFTPQVWRKDGFIIFDQGLGEARDTWVYDLNTNNLRKTDITGLGFGQYGNTGKFAVEVDSWAGDPCNAFMGSGPDYYQLIDPITGKGGIKFGVKGALVYIGAFSPDDGEVLYASSPAIQTTNNTFGGCDKPTQKRNYVVNTQTGTVSSVSDPDKIIKNWGVNIPGAVIENEMGYPGTQYSKISRSTMTIGGKVLTSSSNELQIFSQYYQ